MKIKWDIVIVVSALVASIAFIIICDGIGRNWQ
jgi:hypothetical protein